ncbi:MAG: hypothetical protein H6R39_280, partial [Deltaproteobacteria bacterium]|nr:hypothetical protein [Deltaproteobacteria bacterium]
NAPPVENTEIETGKDSASSESI